MNEIIETEGSVLSGMSQSEIIQIAQQAEQRIDAMKKIKNTAIKLTNEGDWIDQGGNPYLKASGAEKIAGAFGINWSFLSAEPTYEEDDDGHYTYIYHGRFTMAGRSIEIDGSRSSKDPFFKQYDYPENSERVERDVQQRDNKRDVKMAALTNLLGNGITRMLGIRNMTYADLMEFAGIEQKNLGKVSYDKKPPVKKTLSKSSQKEEAKEEKEDEAMIKVKNVGMKETKGNPKYTIYSVGGTGYNTFDKDIADDAKSIEGSNVEALVLFKSGKYGNTIQDNGFVIQGGDLIEEREPGQEG